MNGTSYTAATAGQIVDSFLNLTLPKEEWTHAAHILSGFYLHSKYGDAAMRVMKEHVIKFNEAVGTINSDESGYHETITFFWIEAITQFAGSLKQPGFTDENVGLLCNSRLMDKGLPLEFYTKQHLMSVQARRNVVEPDIKPLNDIFTSL